MSPVADFLRRIFQHPGFVGLHAANFALGLAYSFVVPFMSMWGTLHIGMSSLTFGVFMTVTAISGIMLSIVLSRWSDTHVTRRTTLLLGSTAGALGYVGYAFVTDVVALTLIGSVLLGIATVNMTQLFAYVREELGRAENAGADAPLHTSMLRVSFSTAWIMGPALGAWVMVHFSYRGIFLGAAALFGLFLAGVCCFVQDRPHPPVERQPARLPLLQVLTRRDVFASFSAFVLLFAAFNINLMNLPLLVTQQLGGSNVQVGVVFGIAPVFELPLMIWSGYLATRGHQVGLIRLGVIAAALYFAALIFAQAPWHIYPMQVLSAVAIAITTNITITYFQDMLPGEAGFATSLYGNSFSGGSLLGYFAFGLLRDPLGHRGVYVVCTALCLLALGILLLARRPAAEPVPRLA